MPMFPFHDITPASMIYDYGVFSGAANLELAPYLGSIDFKAQRNTAKVFEEWYGDAAVDEVHTGMVVEASIPMVRSTLAQLAAVTPGAVLIGNVLTVSNKCGSAMYADAVQLAIRPVVDLVPSPTHAEWILIYKVYPVVAAELKYSRSDQRVYLVKFAIFPNQDSGHEGEFYQIGLV